MPETSETPQAASGALVELCDVVFGYGQRVVLDGVSLTVPRGKVTALMGASGGGKTTVLRLIGGQQRAQSGQVLFDGRDVGGMGQARLYATWRRMGILFQFEALLLAFVFFNAIGLLFLPSLLPLLFYFPKVIFHLVLFNVSYYEVGKFMSL